MLVRACCLATALELSAGAALGTEHEQTYALDGKGYQTTTDYSAVAGGPFPVGNDPSETDKGCQQGEDKRSSDLCAQWKAADAAAESAEVAWAQFWTGSVIGFFTLLAAIAAALFAGAAAKHTRRSVDATESMGRAQVRAYVGITKAKVALSRAEPGMIDQSIRPAVEIEVKNWGGSPAYSFDWAASVRYYHVARNEFRGSLAMIIDDFDVVDIGLGEMVSRSLGLGTAPISDEEMAIFREKGIHMDVAIRYAFRDVFGHRIEDERVYTGFFNPLQIGVWTTLQRHPSGRDMIEEQINAEIMRRRYPPPPPYDGGSG